MPRGFSSKFYVHHIRSHGTETRPKTDGKACKAIPAFPRGQSPCQEDLTLSPCAFEKPGTGAAVDSQPRRAFSAKSALRGEAKAIRRRAELADGMSEAEGTPDLPWARPGGLGVAKSGSSRHRRCFSNPIAFSQIAMPMVEPVYSITTPWRPRPGRSFPAS